MAVRLGLLVTALSGLVAVLTVNGPQMTAVEYKSSGLAASTTASTTLLTDKAPVQTLVSDDRPVVTHQPLPDQVKAIYMTACVAGTPSFRQKLVQLAQETEINTIMIDVKDFSGTISFPPESAAWKPAWMAANCGTRDMKDLITMLHDNDIFVVARVTVFQDPFYAPQHPELAVLRESDGGVWRDGKGLAFIDVGARPYWDHIVELAVDSYNIGFDEINFDYVRYPSDGNMKDIAFPNSLSGEYGADKQANLEAFFAYLHEKMTDEELFAKYRHENTGRASSTPWTSADLFGMTTTNYDDLSIGQVQDRAAPYFDFIAPMVYPSHYPNSFLGLGNPNDYPYEVVHHAMSKGVERMESETTPLPGFLHELHYETNASGLSAATGTAQAGTKIATGLYEKPAYTADKFRTWIQDFDYGGDYDAADVRAQIQASYDAGVNSWMIWAPSNIYTRAALDPVKTTLQDAEETIHMSQ